METEKKNIKTNLLVNWLEESYFFVEKTSTKLIIGFTVGFFTFIYTYFFTPFDTGKIKDNLLQISIESTILIVLVILIHFFFASKLFPNYFNKKSWTVGKHIFILIIITLTCGSVIWIYTKFIVSNNLITYNYRDVIINSLKISLIPITLQLLLNSRMQKFKKAYYELKIDQQNKEEIKKKLQTSKINQKEKKSIKIYSYNKKDFVEIKIDKLVYITSEANYASFFIEQNKILKELILRKPLIQIEKELSDYGNIIRCHKSYIINSEYIDDYRGNAHGYYLKMKFFDIEEIPVSRKFTKKDMLELISFK